jgi:nitroimidazol reductase NimA-like FMN-containing flavoprotein (pyridoxamine 5'-phosphate oxidase superfamily)
MRRKDKEITEKSVLLEMLRSARVCRLGMCSLEGEPYVVPLCPAYCEEEHALYFHGSREGQKHTLLRENPRACFEIEEGVTLVENEDPCEWGMRYRSLVGFGKAEFLDAHEEKQRGLNIIVEHYTGKPSEQIFPEQMLQRVDLFRIPIESLTGRQSL